MAAPNRIRANLDLALLGAFGVAVATVAVLWSPMSGYRRRALPIEKERRVLVECLAGGCWLRAQGETSLFRIPAGERIEAVVGDEIMTLGEGSSLVSNFLDDGTELRLSQTGVIRLVKGQQDVSVDDNKGDGVGGGGAMTQTNEVPSSLLYIGEIPVRMVSPAAGTPIVAGAFPVSLHIAFVLDRGGADDAAKLLDWSLFDLTDPARPVKVESFKVEQTTQAGSVAVSFFKDFLVAKAGNYALIPAAFESGVAQSGHKFEVKAPAALESQLEDLLQGVTAGSDRQIEIRTK